MLGFIVGALLGFIPTMLGFAVGKRLGYRKAEQARLARLNALRKIINGKV